MRSSKREAENNRGINRHLITLHQRLYHALSLGTRIYGENKRTWQCTDIEIQRHVLRSIAAFLDSISGDVLNHPLIKDAVADMIGALVWILQRESGPVVSMTAKLVVKLITIIPYTMLEAYVVILARPLSLLLRIHNLEVSVSCATALNMILSNLNAKKEKEVIKILEETTTVARIVCNIKGYSANTMPIEYFQEMGSLLSTILCRWPPSRYLVWNDPMLMKVLEDIYVKPDSSIKIVVLKLYFGLALCGNGAKKLLENGEHILQMMVNCMDGSNTLSVRIEGFKLAQCFAADEQGCLKIIGMCCEPMVKAIVHGMSGSSLKCGKIGNDQMALLMEACKLALITRWAGGHHIYFWKNGICKVLLNLLRKNLQDKPFECSLSLEEHMSFVQELLDENYLLVLRPFIWDILGWLAMHAGEDFSPRIYENELHIDTLITCACLSFLESIQKRHQIYQNDVLNCSKNESASRAVLMMMYSPCKYIASKVRRTLSEVLKPEGKKYVKPLLHSLEYSSSRDNSGLPNKLQVVISLMAVACYSGLPQYRMSVVESEGVKTLLSFIRWCLCNQVHIGRASFAPHIQNIFGKRSCCWVTEDWEGKDILLFYGLWALVGLVHHSFSEKNNIEIFSVETNKLESQLVGTLQEICKKISSPGPRWYAAHILTYFGFYGFQSKCGEKIGKALKEKEFADMQLVLANGDLLNVHRVVLAVHCPSLLPPEQLPSEKKTLNHSSVGNEAKKPCGTFQRVNMSARVDQQVLLKLLEYVYRGYVEVEDELVKKLKSLARHCNLHSLLQMLCHKSVKWGSSIPSSDLALALALSPVGHHFSDILLEAESTELRHWTCSICSLLKPHMHVHKAVLWSSCDYLRAVFQSGMQESQSQILRVPISWEAMIKLVNWFYTDQLPNTASGCLWENMDNDRRLCELKPYVELYWLSEFWILEDLEDACSRIIGSCLESARELSIKVIQMAAKFSLWKLAKVAADYMAPLYHKLQETGDLEELDEMLVDMVRSASVRLYQDGNNCSR